VTALQLAGVKGPDGRWGAARRCGHQQRSFGQPVAGLECRGPEAVRGEALGEALEGGGSDRLGPTERHFPPAELEPLALPGRRASDAELVGEVGPAAHGGAVPRDGLKPADRPLQERRGREQGGGRIQIQRREDPADQSHVVIGRQPADALGAGWLPEGPPDGVEIRHEIAMGHHHASGLGRGARGVLQERQIVLTGSGTEPVRCRVFHSLQGGLPPRHRQLRWHGRAGQQSLDLRCREYHPGCGIPADRRRPGEESREASRRGRRDQHGDAPCVQTPEESGNQLQARRIDDERAVSPALQRLQPRRDGPRAPIQVADSTRCSPGLTVGEKSEAELVGVQLRPPTEEINQGSAARPEGALAISGGRTRHAGRRRSGHGTEPRPPERTARAGGGGESPRRQESGPSLDTRQDFGRTSRSGAIRMSYEFRSKVPSAGDSASSTIKPSAPEPAGGSSVPGRW
jgi:hypothetical protein